MTDKDDEKTPDEVIDGASVAAKILNSMRPSNRERIVKAIQQSQPQIAEKIEQKLYNFEEIADLQPSSVQILIKEIEHRDLVMSLKTASDNVKTVLFDNMTERRRQIVNEDFSALPQVKLRDVEDAQRRIMIKLSALRTSGLLKTQSKNDIWV
jgi:flagellar motor switch protein FliG